MVTTTSSLAVNGKNLDGVASLDARAGTAFVLMGGVNDGTIRVIVKGFGAASLFGAKVHVVVEHTAFANRSTAVMKTEVVQTSDVMISGDQLELSIGNANGNDGYRVSLTALGGSNATAGSGGALTPAGAGSGGAVAIAGSSGSSGRDAGGAGGSSNPPIAPSSGGAGKKPIKNSSTSVAGAGGAATSQVSAPNVGGSSGGVALAQNASSIGASSGCSCRVARTASNRRLRSWWWLVGLLFALRAMRKRIARDGSRMRLPLHWRDRRRRGVSN
jgi:MYXO-CTERM domain-containing protein